MQKSKLKIQIRQPQKQKYRTVNYPSQETEVTSTPTRHVENVVITTKGLQERYIQMLDGTTVENKGKTIN